MLYRNKTIRRAIFYGLFVAAFGVALFYNNALIQKNYDYLDDQQWNSYDHLVAPQSTVIIGFTALIIIAITIDYFVSRRQFTLNPVAATAFGLFAIAGICVLDVLLGSWGIPMRCGDGFSAGNCVLFDGLGEIAYFVVVPVTYVVGFLLLIINARTK